MPMIRVEMLEGRSLDQKRELVKSLSGEMARITGCPLDSIYVVIDDVKKENWGIGEALCYDKFPPKDQG